MEWMLSLGFVLAHLGRAGMPSFSSLPCVSGTVFSIPLGMFLHIPSGYLELFNPGAPPPQLFYTFSCLQFPWHPEPILFGVLQGSSVYSFSRLSFLLLACSLGLMLDPSSFNLMGLF